MSITIAILVTVCAVVGVALTLLTLPGIWFMLLAAGLCQWWHMEEFDGEMMFSWWTLGIGVALALIAEGVEMFASAAGAAKAGGTRRGAIGSVIGGLVGALGGTFIIPIPVVGTIIGAAGGAGLGAIIAERHGARMTWKESAKVGTGAAIGRLAATLAKTAFAVTVAVLLSVAAFV